MNSPEYETLLRDSLLNNSYDWDAMHEQLRHTQLRSYSYLYELQQAYIDYEELMYMTTDASGHDQTKIGQMYLDKTFRARFDVDKDLIGVYNREEFRLSEFYQKPFTIADMINNPKIFDKIPVVMIDDKVIWDYKIYVKIDTTTFSLPFGRYFVLEDIRNPENDHVVYVDHNVTVFTVDNEFYERLLVSKRSIDFNPETGYFRVFKSDLATLPNRKGLMFASFHLPNNAGKQYELGTSMIEMVEKPTYYEAYVNEGIQKTLASYSSTNFYLSLVFITKLNKKTFYSGSDVLVASKADDEYRPHTPLFVIEKDNDLYYQPIPVENMMVFKKNDSGNFVLKKNTTMVKGYYPNIYQIVDPTMRVGDEYKVFYYYYDDATDTRYTNVFDFYYMYLRNIFDADASMEEIVNTIYYNLDTDKSNFFQHLGETDPYTGMTHEELISLAASIMQYNTGDPMENAELVSIATALRRYGIESTWITAPLSFSPLPDVFWAER